MSVEAIELAHFSVVDYVILTMVLVISLGIGVYHGIKSNRTTDDFLLASRSLSPIPVACSLMVSFLSSVSILGYTAEVYGYGLQMYVLVPGFILGMLVSANVIMPIFYNLRLRSINEYIILRFKSPALKYLMLISTSLNQILVLGIILYAPTLALAAVTPISSDTYILIIGVVVTLYCSVGGMKAVVWTDLFQTIFLFFGVVLITASALSKAGGLTNAWRIALENGRLEAFDMRIGLFERHTAINTFIMGLTSYGYISSFHQATVQRVATQCSLRNAKGVMYANIVGTFIIKTVIFLGGIGIYAAYHGCDPLTLGLIEKRDQITPFYVMHRLGHWTGVPGLFVACLFCGTLSSISSTLNTVPTVLWNDFIIELQYFRKASEKIKMIFNKLLTLSLGIAMIGLAFLASRTRGVVTAATTVSSIVSGPATGVFVMGIAVPVVGKTGAIAGFLTSFGVMAWIGLGAKFYGDSTPLLPLETHLCENSTAISTSNVTTEMSQFILPSPKMHQPHWYNISYAYFCLIGIVICISVALVVSCVTGWEKLANVQPEHVISCLRGKVGSSNSENFEAMESFLDGATHASKKTELKSTTKTIVRKWKASAKIAEL